MVMFTNVNDVTKCKKKIKCATHKNGLKRYVLTSMHSSRMHTARLLTVSHSIRIWGMVHKHVFRQTPLYLGRPLLHLGRPPEGRPPKRQTLLRRQTPFRKGVVPHTDLMVCT